MKKFSVFLLCLLLFFGLGSVANANLLLNGDFETLDGRVGINNGLALNGLANGDWDVYTNIPSWYKYGSGSGIEIQKNTIVAAHSPEHYVELDSNENSGMYQFVNLTAGTTYELSFWYRPRTDTPIDNGIDVFFNDPNASILSVNGISSDITDWAQYSVQIGALKTGNFLAFHATGLSNSLGGFIDDVELKAVPEPATMLLFGLGLVGLATIQRKKFFKK